MSKPSTNIDQNQESAESISDNNSGSIHASTPEVTNAEISDKDSISQVSTLDVLNTEVTGDTVTPTIELSDNQDSSSTSETVDNSKSITKTLTCAKWIIKVMKSSFHSSITVWRKMVGTARSAPVSVTSE